MKKKEKSILLIYPDFFSNNPGSVRVSRMIRSLKSQAEIILLTKGPGSGVRKTPWGFLLVTKQTVKEKNNHQKTKKQISLSSSKSFVANTLLCPDAGVFWNYKVLKKEEFKEFFSRCDRVISSSPPNSVHLLALSLAKIYKYKWLMDMRDGWLDEPLKKTVFFLKPLESWQERACLKACRTVLVNTDLWKEKLEKRYPFLKKKTEVLMNALDDDFFELCQKKADPPLDNYLLYAGAFRLSDKKRTVKSLLKPLCHLLPQTKIRKIVLVGRFHDLDLKEVEFFKNHAQLKIETLHEVSRKALADLFSGASGFLLNSYSECALPSKFLDYLAVSRPILGFCKKDSLLDKIAKNLDFVFSTSLETPDKKTILNFIEKAEGPVINENRGVYRFRESFFRETLRSFL